MAQRLTALIVISATLRRQAELACCPLQKGHAEPFLQRRHLAADGGDGHAECMRGPAEAPELRNPDKDGDVVQICHVRFLHG
jgi:hypothetical protein